MRIYKNLVLILVCFIIFTILATKGLFDESMPHSDESRHVMDGVFIRDFVCAFPDSFKNPIGYAIDYYGRYPALSLLFYYPPFFAIVEGVFFLLFGISLPMAHIVVLIFGLVAIVFWFLLCKDIFDSKIAFISTLFLFTDKNIVEWSSRIMLEMPTLSMGIVAFYFLNRYFITSRYTQFYMAMLFAIISVLTKQPIGFIFLVFAGLIILYKRNKIFNKEILIPAILTFFFVLFYSYFTLKYSKLYVETVILGGEGIIQRAKSRLLLYPRLIFGNIDRIILTFAVSGFFYLTFNRRLLKKGWIFLFWILGFYLANLFLRTGFLMRYAFYVLPPVYLYAGIGMCIIPMIVRRYVIKYFYLAATSLVLLSQIYTSLCNVGNVYIRGYREVARYVVENFYGRCVLFDGWLDGNFIFYVRQFDKTQKIIVLRGSKMLASYATFKIYKYRELVKTKKDIIRLIKNCNVRLIVIEREDIIGTQPSRLLRELLKGRHFQLVKEVKLKTNMQQMIGNSLAIYRYVGPMGKPNKYIEIPLSGIDKVFKVKL